MYAENLFLTIRERNDLESIYRMMCNHFSDKTVTRLNIELCEPMVFVYAVHLNSQTNVNEFIGCFSAQKETRIGKELMEIYKRHKDLMNEGDDTLHIDYICYVVDDALEYSTEEEF